MMQFTVFRLLSSLKNRSSALQLLDRFLLDVRPHGNGSFRLRFVKPFSRLAVSRKKKPQVLMNSNLRHENVGTDGGTRTHTLLELDFESSASTIPPRRHVECRD